MNEIELQLQLQRQKADYENTIRTLKSKHKKEINHLKMVIRKLRKNAEDTIKITRNI